MNSLFVIACSLACLLSPALGACSKDTDGILTCSSCPEGDVPVHYKIPENVTTIADEAFLYCEYMGSVEFPASLTTIGNRAFDGAGLKSVDLSHTKVHTIGVRAFNSNYGLESVKFPTTLTTISNYAFRFTSVKSFTYHLAPGGSLPANRPSCSDTCEEIVVCPAGGVFINDSCGFVGHCPCPRGIAINGTCKLLLEEASPSELKEAYKKTEC